MWTGGNVLKRVDVVVARGQGRMRRKMEDVEIDIEMMRKDGVEKTTKERMMKQEREKERERG